MKNKAVIALLAQKGGAGKTTVTMQLAAGLRMRGQTTAVADLDPQSSALRWAQAAPTETPFPAPVVRLAGKQQVIAAGLKVLTARHHFVLLDCPPSLEHAHMRAALALADLILIPLVPGPLDLWSARATEQAVLAEQARRPGLRAALVPNRMQNTKLTGTVLEVAREFTLPVLGSTLGQRTAYGQAAIHGCSVFQLGRTALAAQDEVLALADAVFALLAAPPASA